MIIIGFLFMVMQDADFLRKSQWNIFLNPFDPTYGLNETTWAIISMMNRIILMIGTSIFLLTGLLNLQKREKFM
jgi:hypothetical protein